MNAPRLEHRCVMPGPSRILRFLPLGLLLGASATLASGDDPARYSAERGGVRLTTSADRESARVAESIALTVAATAPPGVSLNFPPAAEKLGDFEVVDVADTFDIPLAEGRQWTRVYRLECFVSGEHVIPAIAVAFADRRRGAAGSDATQDAAQDTILSTPIKIRIVSELEGRADPLKFRDIKSVVELRSEPPPSQAWIVWLCGAVGVGAAVGGALLVWRRGRREPAADRWALTELKRLEESQLRVGGDFQELYFQLTEIVRGYAERRFGIAASKWTTVEFMERLRNDRLIDAPQQAALGKFLAAADLVKFARVEPSSDEASAAFSAAREFIRQSASTDAASTDAASPSTQSEASAATSATTDATSLAEEAD